MKNFFMLFAAVAFVSGIVGFSAHADEQTSQSDTLAIDQAMMDQPSDPNQPTKPGKQGPCSKIGLDDAQKATLKDARYQFQQTMINLQAQAKLARLNYRKQIGDANATYETAQPVAAAVADAASKLIAARIGFRTEVLFQILKPAQRGPALACERMMKRMKRHHRGGHGNHGGGHNGGGDGAKGH